MPDKPPVFIVGSPRSGTTFLRNVLDRHPYLAICGETRFFADIYKRRWTFGSLDKIENRRRLVERYLATARMRRLGVDLAPLADQLLRQATSYPALFTGILKYYAAAHGKERYGEKTPHHAFYADTLCKWYPGAAIIHLVRDPRDVVASLERIRWAPDSVLSNTWMWRLFNQAAGRMRNHRGYLLVHYETLVTQPEQELRRICTHLDAECPLSILLASDHMDGPYSWPRHAAGPLTTERLSKWREQLDRDEVSLIEWAAGDDMRMYGYPRSAFGGSIKAALQGIAVAVRDSLRRGIEDIPYVWCRVTQPRNLAAQEYWKYRHAWDVVFPGLQPTMK